MKLKTHTKILIIGCLVGLAMLLYPSFSNFWNTHFSTHAINEYAEVMEQLDTADYEGIWKSAQEYNQLMLLRENHYALSPELEARYWDELDVTGKGLIGYIEISKLAVSLPLYHGTSDEVLLRSAGHVDWSFLPIGGAGTHSVISGHRGLPSAKLFTDLDDLREGDRFDLVILGETLTYEVDQIRTVLPEDTADLLPTVGRDYCTLVTCTPYGINTHRLLVRGHRVESVEEEEVHVIAEAVIIEPLVVAPVLAFPLLFILLMAVLLKKPPRRTNLEEELQALENGDYR